MMLTLSIKGMLQEVGMTVRTTIHLDEQLLARLRRAIPPRGLSRFINETLVEKIEVIERQQIEAAMKEGYLLTREDRATVDEDWRVVDADYQ
jgi:hypothetical protein